MKKYKIIQYQFVTDCPCCIDESKFKQYRKQREKRIRRDNKKEILNQLKELQAKY